MWNASEAKKLFNAGLIWEGNRLVVEAWRMRNRIVGGVPTSPWVAPAWGPKKNGGVTGNEHVMRGFFFFFFFFLNQYSHTAETMAKP